MLSPHVRASLPTGFDGQETHYGQMMMLYVALDGTVRAFGHGGSDGTHAYAWPDRDLIVLYFTQSRGNLTFLEFEKALFRFVIDPEAGAQAAAKD